MRVAIITSSNEGYDFFKEHLSFRQVEECEGIEIARGKLQNQPVLVISSEKVDAHRFLDYIAHEEITYIISLGYLKEFSAPLVPGDILLAGEINSAATNAKLVDWCLAAVDNTEEFSSLRVVVGALYNSASADIREGNVFGIDSEAAQLLTSAEQKGIEVLFIRLIKSELNCVDEEQFHKENAQKLFWLVKGVLDQLNKYRQHLTSEASVV